MELERFEQPDFHFDKSRYDVLGFVERSWNASREINPATGEFFHSEEDRHTATATAYVVAIELGAEILIDEYGHYLDEDYKSWLDSEENKFIRKLVLEQAHTDVENIEQTISLARNVYRSFISTATTPVKLPQDKTTGKSVLIDKQQKTLSPPEVSLEINGRQPTLYKKSYNQ